MANTTGRSGHGSTPFNRITVTSSRPAAPTTSWWMGKDRATFRQVAEVEARRMNGVALPPASAEYLDDTHHRRML